MDIYFKSIWMHIKCALEYKTSFILTLIAAGLSTFLKFLATVFLISGFGSIKGWDVNTIIFTTGIVFFGHSITEMFGRGMDHFYKQVKDGLLDRALVRPRTITLQVLCSDFDGAKIGRIIESAIMLIYGTINMNIIWSPYKVIVYCLMIFGSVVLFGAILVLKASFSFWTIEGMEFMNIISDGGRDLSAYPIDVYKKWFADIFTYIIPCGLVNYYPLLYLLDKGSSPIWYGLTPLFTLVFLGIICVIWNKGLKNYKSTGS